jgi:hypothetical protein
MSKTRVKTEQEKEKKSERPIRRTREGGE